MDNRTGSKKFGEIMRRARTARRLSQERVADIIGISVTYCREIEHGKYIPTWMIWLKICRLLELDIDKLYSVCIDDRNTVGELAVQAF